MPLSRNTLKFERAFAEICRTGKFRKIPGLRKDRALVYRDLVFNNVRATLERAYPITRKGLGERAWLKFIQDFFAKNPHSEPELWKMPQGLVDFSKKYKGARRFKKAYLDDLLHFEWIEIAIHMMPDRNVTSYRPQGNLETDALALNLECELLRYDYPVFRLPPQQLLKKKGDYFLLAFRHPEHLDVEFIELSPFCALLFENLHKTKGLVPKAIQKTLKGLPKKTWGHLQSEALGFMGFLLERRAVLGFAIMP